MSVRWRVLLLGMVVAFIGVLGSAQAAGYGKGAKYQVEVSLNCTSAHNCTAASLPPGRGYGVWLWLELNADGTGDYTGSDCAHRLGGDTGAFSASGDLTWVDDGSNLVISDVTLIGGTTQVTITVPDQVGHYVEDGTQVISVVDSSLSLPPLVGATQIQVAP